MLNSTNDKRKKYAHYAAHCSYLSGAATDPDARAIQSEMVAEWLKLADAMRHPLPIEKMGEKMGKSPLAQRARVSAADDKKENNQSR